MFHWEGETGFSLLFSLLEGRFELKSDRSRTKGESNPPRCCSAIQSR